MADMVMLLTARVAKVSDLVLGLVAAIVGRAPDMEIQGLELVLIPVVAECIRDCAIY